MALAVGRRLARTMHTTAVRLDQIAPPHPVSHMRPIVYADSARLAPEGKHRHPYSLSEFQKAEGAAPGDYEMQYQLLRGQLDKLHHEFWLDVRPGRVCSGYCSFIPTEQFALQRSQRIRSRGTPRVRNCSRKGRSIIDIPQAMAQS